ncbi:MAG: Cys-tRNA(Pro) deacylase [Deltaproteobacteria bacterium]|nr:Cys-tRNA(Pro) deacylase [Deltaproteobacteria bacterium]TLN00658.1 MAG: Cys-tRNA(Pro) deacylase [bacterium]
MAKDKLPVTPAIRVLRSEKVEFTPHLYAYEDKGGTAVCARELGFPEHTIIKTLVMEDDRENPLIILMHGDQQVSTRELARFLGVKSVVPCSADKASRLTGYLVGGTSPFGTKRDLPVYLEETILALPQIYLNGGKRGFLVGISPQDVVRVLKPVLVHVATQAD